MKSLASLFPFLFLVAPLAAEAARVEGKRFVYKSVDGRDLSIYVTGAEAASDRGMKPAIVFFHGGGWVGGAPGQFTEHSKYFASRGMVCFQVEYRLLDKKSKEPPVTCTEDAVAAMRWVRENASTFGIDPNRIASAGGSAGGHLAAFVGTVDVGTVKVGGSGGEGSSVSPKSNAMLLFNPVYDNGPGGWGTARVGDRYREFSPAHNLTADDPPSIVFLGSNDKLIPVSTAEKFRDASKGLGIESELHVYDGQPHGFFNHGRDGNRWYLETVTAADRFLSKLGWIQGEPTLKNR